MLAARKYRPDDIVYLLLRWKWVVIIPWLLITAGVAIYSRTLPNRYRAESVIQVVPQRVPESLVRSTVTARIEDRLTAITQQILSRTRLERIIQDFGLFTEERKTMLMEDVVQKMRDDIGEVRMVKGDAFQVNFSSTDARTAMRVTERLASLFVEENLRDREVLAEGANQFLDSQLDDARRRLQEHEKKLEDFRRLNNGELPTQLAANLQAVQNTENQILSLAESINRDRDQRLNVERLMADTTAESAYSSPGTVSTAQGEAPSNPAARLEFSRKALQELRLRLKPDHPDVQSLQGTIRELEQTVAAEARRAPASPATEAAVAPAPASPAEAIRRNRSRELKVQLETIDREIARRTAAQKKLQAQSIDLQQRIDRTPTRESEMVALTRDYDTLQKIYTTLLAKGEEAKVSANLERRQIGEQFKVIDAARLPQQPYSPNRIQMNAIGFAVGLAIGLALIGLIEFLDNSFRTHEEIATTLQLPVLATVPAIFTAVERSKRLRTRLVGAAVSVAVILGGVGAVAVWKRDLIISWWR